jgi:hypothetical protein
LISTPEGQKAWAHRIANAAKTVLGRTDLQDGLHSVHYFGSHTDVDAALPFTELAAKSA